MSQLPMGTVTLLFTDIEGFTYLLQQLGERYASVLIECRELLRTAFSGHHGHEVETGGWILRSLCSRQRCNSGNSGCTTCAHDSSLT